MKTDDLAAVSVKVSIFEKSDFFDLSNPPYLLESAYREEGIWAMFPWPVTVRALANADTASQNPQYDFPGKID